MSPQKDNFDLLRGAMLALEHPVSKTESLEVRIQKRRCQLESAGLPEIIILETLNIEFIPGYKELSIRQEVAKKIFGGGLNESRGSSPYNK